MRWIATLGEALVDRAAGLIAVPAAVTIGVSALLYWIFDVVPAGGAPAGAGVQRREASTAIDSLAINQTLLVHGTLPSANADLSAVPLSEYCRKPRVDPVDFGQQQVRV